MPHFKVPPGPRGFWPLGNTLQYARDPLGFLTHCARTFGDVVRLTGPGLTFYMFNHPDQIETVLRSEHRHFIKWKLLRDTSSVFGSGLLTSEGDFWKRQRRLMTPAFQMKQLQTYADDMVRATHRLLATWQAGDTRIISDDMMGLTLAIIGKTLFDVDIESTAHNMGPVLGSVMNYYGDPANSLVLPQWVPTPANLRFRRAVRTLDGMIKGMIQERRGRGASGQDLLSRLVLAQDEEGSRMTDQQLRDELVTLGFAGHKTTAAALTYSFYLLSQAPDVEERVVEEVRRVLGNRPPTAADVPDLKFTECVVKEALRLYPPSWGIGREAITDCEVGGYTVPKGTQVMTVQYVVHRDPRWFEEPDAFRPQRWQGDLEGRLPRCAYFPFGDGPRVCIGGGFAMLETVLILAAVLQRYRLELVSGQKFRLVPSITLWPVPGIKMVVRGRTVGAATS
jgi:cytochrome P450